MSQTLITAFESEPAQAEDEGEAAEDAGASGLSLFWRTFFLLALLLLGSILAWLQALHSFEIEPRAVQMAQQLASLVNLSRAAVIHADAIARVSLLKTMAEEEGLRIVPREPGDTYVSVDSDELMHDIAVELRRHLGAKTVVARQVNQRPGLWIGFEIDGDDYWLLTGLERFSPGGGKTWIMWLMVAAGLSLAGAAVIARRINRPLRELSFAASRVRDGDFGASPLDESVSTSEIRDVNIGFNRMAQRLAKLDQDRAVMLAGISHDLRTPLARLRLETELSVADPVAREYMASDIAQLDAIIDKFLEYARPNTVTLEPLLLSEVLEQCIFSLRDQPDVRIKVMMDPGLRALADAVELGRVLSNLLENARKYGKTVSTGIANIDITAIARDRSIFIKVRDHGTGVAADQLANLTKPFYRGEAARTAANGAGLGLAVVEKTMRRMGGAMALNNSSTGGLSINLRLQRAPAPGP